MSTVPRLKQNPLKKSGNKSYLLDIIEIIVRITPNDK